MSLKPHFVKIEKNLKFKFILAVLCMPRFLCKSEPLKYLPLKPDGDGKREGRWRRHTGPSGSAARDESRPTDWRPLTDGPPNGGPPTDQDAVPRLLFFHQEDYLRVSGSPPYRVCSSLFFCRKTAPEISGPRQEK